MRRATVSAGSSKWGYDAARFTVMRKKIDICHLTDLLGRPDVGKRHLAVRPRLAAIQQQVDLIGIL